MSYQRKTRDVWHFDINYGQGWEHELSEYTRAEIKARRREYAENCPEYLTRTRKGRERIVDAPHDPPGYAARVRELEAEGLTTSDAQGCADMEFRNGRAPA